MAFIKFVGTGRKTRGPAISIWKRGQINLNRSFLEFFKIKENYVILFYDSEGKRIGLKFTNDKQEEGAMHLIQHIEGSKSFSCVPFLRINKINYQKTYRYTPYIDPETKMVAFDL